MNDRIDHRNVDIEIEKRVGDIAPAHDHQIGSLANFKLSDVGIEWRRAGAVPRAPVQRLRILVRREARPGQRAHSGTDTQSPARLGLAQQT